MIYGVKHQSRAISEQKAISEQSSKFLCTTDGLWSYASKQTNSEWSSKFLCNTDDLWDYASNQNNFKVKYWILCVTDELWSCVYYKAYKWTLLN